MLTATEFSQKYTYHWPREPLDTNPAWKINPNGTCQRSMPEKLEDLRQDSRWPSFFPSSLSLVTTGNLQTPVLEKVVGASIVNRFPYIICLSFCRKALSDRHYVRGSFMAEIERSGEVAVQFVPPGDELDQIMSVISAGSDEESTSRLRQTKAALREGATVKCPVLESAYLVYEGKLACKSRDFEGNPIFENPWIDVGSHRLYFFEITAIQLQESIAQGEHQIAWRSLPLAEDLSPRGFLPKPGNEGAGQARYQKGFTPHYRFPSAGTIGFHYDEKRDGMAIRHLARTAEGQVELDNDKARWPCFFPSSLGLITSWSSAGLPNLMPCGSTTIVSRHPLVVAPCVSYISINERYAPRASYDAIKTQGRFGCGVPMVNDELVDAIKYTGTQSILSDPDKVKNAGLEIEALEGAPWIKAAPIHYDCEVISSVKLGTHEMFFGEVRSIHAHPDLARKGRLLWNPWAQVEAAA